MKALLIGLVLAIATVFAVKVFVPSDPEGAARTQALISARQEARAAKERTERMKLIAEKRITEGMSPADVEASWGKPVRKYSSNGAGGSSETWFYHTSVLYFDEGRLVRWTVES